MNPRISPLPKAAEEAGARCGAGVPPAVFLPQGSSLTIRSRRLPHWEVHGGTYFLTFRLADSFPSDARRKIIFERENIRRRAAQAGRKLSTNEETKLRELHAPHVEEALDKGLGSCALRDSQIAQLLSDAIREFDGIRYRLFAWCVMPNHAHVLFQVNEAQTLAGIVHSWKSFTAKAANRVLARRGEFWQREYYDHLIRNVEEFDRAERYILDNPSKAGLKDWPWVWSWRR